MKKALAKAASALIAPVMNKVFEWVFGWAKKLYLKIEDKRYLRKKKKADKIKAMEYKDATDKDSAGDNFRKLP